jgi:hypothetical protein
MCLRGSGMCVRGSDLPLVLRFFVRFPNRSDGVVKLGKVSLFVTHYILVSRYMCCSICGSVT